MKNIRGRLKRVFPKFEAERSHPRGVNGLSKIRFFLAPKNFERLKNREDSSDFDDFWTKLIASTRSVFRKKIRANVFDKCSRKLRETVVAGSVACAERRNKILHNDGI